MSNLRQTHNLATTYFLKSFFVYIIQEISCKTFVLLKISEKFSSFFLHNLKKQEINYTASLAFDRLQNSAKKSMKPIVKPM